MMLHALIQLDKICEMHTFAMTSRLLYIDERLFYRLQVH